MVFWFLSTVVIIFVFGWNVNELLLTWGKK